jgi:hypothetical protein
LKNKILFWIDASLVEFGVAKYMQFNSNYEFYGIFDLNYKLKNNFINQSIVSFKKEWFFWDHVDSKPTEVDMEYLKHFEDKFHINLWNLAYSERVFSKFNPFHVFSSNEILSILEQECKFLEHVLSEINPDFLIIKVTDFHRNHLLSLMCQSLGIKVLSIIPTRLGSRTCISSDVNKIESWWTENIEETKQFDFNHFLKNNGRYRQTTKIISSGTSLSFLTKIKLGLNWALTDITKDFHKTYDHIGITRFKVLIFFIKSIFKKYFRKLFIDKHFSKEIIDEKFIFFTLQVEPERNLSLDAPFYTNQLSIIENIAKSLPIDCTLYVKEHYNMINRNWRPISEYKKLLKMSNVKLIHPSVPPNILFEKCLAVSTISGTAGLEGSYYGKPSIIFADTIYSNLSFVTRITNFDELSKKISNSLNQKIDMIELEKFLKLIYSASFELDAFNLSGEISKKFHHSGFIISSSINLENLNQFFEKNIDTYQKLAKEFSNSITKYLNFKVN